ncbi:unnamed protein product, partial [Ectocarpus sp. 8 AP-2014]
WILTSFSRRLAWRCLHRLDNEPGHALLRSSVLSRTADAMPRQPPPDNSRTTRARGAGDGLEQRESERRGTFSRPLPPSPPPRSRGRPQSPVRSPSPAPRPMAVGVSPYRPVAPSSSLEMEIKAGTFDDDYSARFSRSFGHGFGADRGNGPAAARTRASAKKEDRKKTSTRRS